MQSASFVLSLVFLLLATRDTFANTHHGLEKIAVQAGNEFAVGGGSHLTTTDNKDVFDAVPTVANVGDRNGKLGGRKMMKKLVLKKDIVKEEASEAKGNLAANFKLSGSSLSTQPVKVKVGGFMAFSADYHGPKSHPPKNN